MPTFKLLAAAVTLAVGAVVFGAEPPRAPVVGTIRVDAVELIDSGKTVDGAEAIGVDYGNYHYLFASEKSKAAFSANPTKYEVQQGGACGRMGPMSAICRTEIYDVYQGKLYLFASDMCRETFRKMPERCIETDEAPPASDAPSQAEGRALLDKCVRWMAGAGGWATIDGLKSIESRREKTREFQGKSTRESQAVVILFPSCVKREYTWDTLVYTDVVGPAGAYQSSPEYAYRPLHAQQQRAMERLRDGNLLSMLRLRSSPEFKVTALKAVPGEDFRRVVCSYGGTNTTLLVSPDDGTLKGQVHRGRGERAILGTIERRFTSYETVGGLKLPTAWTATFDGSPSEPQSASGVVWHVDTVNESMFVYKPAP